MTPEVTISHVLVGVNFDDASAAALKMAGALAAAWDADITVCHAETAGRAAYFTAAQIDVLEAEREQARAGIADQLRLFADRHVGRHVRVVIGEGPPQDAMLGMAASFDLIVVGTHRRHGARRWWLGSVAEAVVRHSPRPVLVVPAAAVVPDMRRAPTILAAGGDGTAADAWVDVLRMTLGGQVGSAGGYPSMCTGPRPERGCDRAIDGSGRRRSRAVRRNCAGAQGMCPSGTVRPVS